MYFKAIFNMFLLFEYHLVYNYPDNTKVILMFNFISTNSNKLYLLTFY